MSTTDGAGWGRDPARRLTAERVRNARFARATLGRRGYSEEEVDAFLTRVAEDVAARDAAEASLREEVARLKHALRTWQSEQSQQRGTSRPPERPSDEAVTIISHAQQQAEAYLYQAQEYGRQVAMQARQQADHLLREAQQRAEQAAAAAARAYQERPGAGHAEIEEIERRIAWLKTFARAVQVQLEAATGAFMREVGTLVEDLDVPPPPQPRRPDREPATPPPSS